MKTKIKRHSRSVLSVVLAVCMLLSCVAVGIIATNAAYIGGSPKAAENVKANTADVADGTDDAADTENAAVGAKAPEAVGANAGESVGTNIDAGGSENYCIYFQSKNGSDFDTEYYNAYNVEITVTVADLKLDGNNLKFKVKKTAGGDVWYGNNNKVNAPGADTVLADNINNGGYFQNAKNYTSIKFKVARDGNNLKMYWVSGVSTSYTISYGSVSGGSFASNNPTSANSGSSVSVTVQPDPGYQLDTFTVTNSSNNQSVGTSGSGNTRTFTMPSANVSISATFTLASYAVTASATGCSITGLNSPYTYGSNVTFRLTPNENYALKSLTVKQGSSNVSTTKTDGEGYSDYSFTMPAGAVAITAVCATTVGTATVYFKSATAYVYHPIISINGGAEQEMTLKLSGETDSDIIYLNPTKVNAPRSETGSLRYAWYKATLTGVDTSKPVSFMIRGTDTYMEATGSFTIESGASIWLACDNLMEGSELVNVTSLSAAQRDFYDTPLNMIDD